MERVSKMPKGVHKLTCTATHIGLDVPDELAFPALLQRLVNRSKRTKNGCLEWTGWCTATGYGSTAFRGRGQSTHRLMYLAVIGPIPEGMQVLHSCDNPPCMNPRHLSLGNGQENMQQAVERGRHYEAEKTHCDRGHELGGDNVRKDGNGSRHCKTCARARHRINAGWPEDLAYSVPKGAVGQVPSDLKRVKPPIRRKHGSSHCTKGHELSGRNRYVTPKNQIECRKCRQIARDGFAAKQLAKRASHFSGGAGE